VSHYVGFINVKVFSSRYNFKTKEKPGLDIYVRQRKNIKVPVMIQDLSITAGRTKRKYTNVVKLVII